MGGKDKERKKETKESLLFSGGPTSTGPTRSASRKRRSKLKKKNRKRTLSRNVVRVSMAYSDSLAPAFGGALVVAGAAAATTEEGEAFEERRAGAGDEAAAALERALRGRYEFGFLFFAGEKEG